MLDATQQQHLTEQVRQQLSTIIDPEIGRNIVEMGLIYLVEIDPDGNVGIVMTTTTKGCPAASFLTEAARASVASLNDVGNVEVTLTYEPMWHHGMIQS